jgi:putative redox protein
MVRIKAGIGLEPYKIQIKTLSGNILLADEPLEKGGKDVGFSPKELLASALAACTCATVRMYVERNGWDLPQIDVFIDLIEEEGKTIFNRKVHFEGNLDEDQQKRLLNVANSCPVHKILSHEIEVNTEQS